MRALIIVVCLLLAFLPDRVGATEPVIESDDLDNIALAKKLLAEDDPWAAKDLLEREQVRRPGDPGIRALLGEVYAKLAIRMAAEKRPTEALAFTEKALTINPDQVELIYTRALSHELLKNYDGAIGAFEDVLRLSSGYRDAKSRLVYLYKLRGQDYLKKGDLNSAQSDFQNLLRHEATDPDANYYLGYIALQFKSYDAARQFLTAALQDERLRHMAEMYLGMVEAETQHWPLTIEWMRKARVEERLRTQTDPYLSAAHYNLGVAALKEKRLDEADANFQEVLRLDPQHKDALFNLALTWDAKGDLEAARSYYQRVRALEPGYRKVEVGLAYVDYRIAVRYFDNGALEKAETLLREAANLDSSRGEPNFYLGMIYRRWKEDDRALPQFDAAIEKAAFLTQAHFEAAEIHFQRQNWQQVIEHLDVLRRLDKAYQSDKVLAYLRESWWRLALADVQDGHWPEAERKLKEVLKYPPDLPITHYYLGLSYLRQRFYDSAISELETAYKGLPKDVDVRKGLSEARYQRGMAAFTVQRYTDAQVDLSRAAEVDPNRPEVQYQLARTRIELKRFPEAIAALEKLAHADPPFRESVDELARAYAGYGEDLLDRNQRAQAKTYFTKALAINPAEMGAQYGVGVMALEEKRYEEAARNLQAVYDRAPDYRRTYAKLIEAYLNLGYRAYDKKDRASARTYLQKVVDLDPNHGEALYYLGDIEAVEKNYELAKNYFERAINRRVKLVEAHYGLGTVLFEMQEFGLAADHFEEVIKVNPVYKNVDSYVRRALRNEADRLYLNGRAGESVAYYERYLKYEAKDEKVHLRLAEIAEKAGFIDVALNWYERALPLLKTDPDPIRFKVAMMAYKAGQFERALNHANKTKSSEGKELRGLLYLAIGKREKAAGHVADAVAALKQALAIMPEHPEVLFEYGKLRLDANDAAGAAPLLRKAVDLNPTLPEGQQLVARAYRQLGADAFAKERLDEADRHYKTSQIYEPSDEADYIVGVIAFLKKDYRTALQQFELIEAKNPRYQALQTYLKDTLCALGEQAIAQNDLVNARDWVGRCAKFNPSDRKLRYELAILAFKAQAYEDARTRFRDIVFNARSQFPEAEGYLVDTLFALEDRAFKAGDYAKARQYAEEILERTPNSYRGRLLRARNLEAEGSLEEAEKELRAVLAARPGLNEAVEALKRVQAARAAKP